MNCPWLLFNPDHEAKVLYVEILMQKFIECQPANLKETDKFCEDFYPIIDQIQATCLANGFRQVCSTNLEGVQVSQVRPHVFLKISWNVYQHTKNCILLDGFAVSNNQSPIVVAIIEAVRGFLPPFMRNVITLVPSQDQDHKSHEDNEEWSETFSEEPEEVI
jgi:hypothetical protein